MCNALESISGETFYLQHLTRLERFEKDLVHRVHLHTEIVLIDYLLKNNINESNGSKEVEIGISKMSCLLCSYYINALNEKHNRCFCQSNSTNGKIYVKWRLLADEDPSIVDSINEKLIDKIQRVITRLCLESDRTGSKESGNSDIMFTSMEGDGFDMERYSCFEP